MADLQALTARAVERGLVLLPCLCCEGAGHHDCDALYCGNPQSCRACNGTGQDRTPGGLLMALARWCADIPSQGSQWRVQVWSRRIVLAWRALPGDGRGVAYRERHDGTPEGITRAALTAWIAAKETAHG